MANSCKQCGQLTTGQNKFCSRSHATSYNNRTRKRIPGAYDTPKKMRTKRLPKECIICGKLHNNKVYCSKECKTGLSFKHSVPDRAIEEPIFTLQGRGF